MASTDTRNAESNSNSKRLWQMITVGVFSALIGLAGCGGGKSDPNKVVVGTMSGQETTLMETARDVAKERYGLTLEIVQYTDYTKPNSDLESKKIDANVFQHLPYLELAMKAHGYDFTVVGKTFVYPMGLYSEKHTHVADFPEGATIAIPADPSNLARALLLLQDHNLIGLDSERFTVTLENIKSNPKHWAFKEVTQEELVKLMPELDGAIINTNYAVNMDLHPSTDALVHEAATSPYANLVVVRTEYAKEEKFTKLVAALHSPEVVAKAQELFKDGAIPAWSTTSRKAP
ncbi:MAG: MetQ/NlpA family ABC transporter substrate-binding protein [Pseudomonadota bacterium]